MKRNRPAKTLLALLLLSIAGISYGFDKAKLESHLRKALNLDSRTKITVGDPVPSDINGMISIPLTIEGGQYPILMTKDEKKYIWGQVIDFTTDPDKERMKNISLADVHSQGSASAPVTIVEYSDLECPHCREAHKVLSGQLYKAYTKEQVRWVAKPFPLNGHDWAEPAAIASECAARQKESNYWQMNDKYFENMPTISTATFPTVTLTYAADLKLKMAAFKKCQADPAVQQRVQASKIEGMKAGVTSTPTFFVNGRMLRGFRDFDQIKGVVDEKLQEASGK